MVGQIAKTPTHWKDEKFSAVVDIFIKIGSRSNISWI